MSNQPKQARIRGGTFNIVGSRISGVELLQKRVAPSAIHNSAQNIDPPRCRPGTRVAILQNIFDWIIQSEHREEWLLWLNGAAGAGKTSIMQTIAERCEQAAIPIASFFFCRSDSTRNNMTALVATLIYQLIRVIPETSNDILLTIESNPLIFAQSLESQLQKLLIQPLLRLPKHLQQLFVVFIDGLDECDDRSFQSSLIKLFGAVSRNRDSPIIFLIASRREPQIEAAFAGSQVSHLLQILSLDNSGIEQASKDIRLYLTTRFEEIKNTHMFRHLLPNNWPTLTAIEEIVTTSSGQFIYAFVAINYVSSAHGNPAHLLDVVLEIQSRNSSSLNPFINLDALYQHIFSQTEALNEVLNIIAFVLFTKQHNTYVVASLFGLASETLSLYFADLASVIECGTEIIFRHASLPDFLLDQSRSEKYHISHEEHGTTLACIFLEKSPPVLDPHSMEDNLNVISMQEIDQLDAIFTVLAWAKPSDRLRQACLNFDITFYDVDKVSKATEICLGILERLDTLDFDNDRLIHRHLASVFAPYITSQWRDLEDHRKEAIARKYPELKDRVDRNLQKRSKFRKVTSAQ